MSETESTKNEAYDETHEKIIVWIILGILMIGLALLAVGIVWAIKDLFTKSAWEDFKQANIATILFTIGIILMGLFFLVLFLFVVFKRGKTRIAKRLFAHKPSLELKEGEEYLPAKLITAGTLISIFLICAGLVIASINALVSGIGGSSTSFWSQFVDLHETIGIGLIILIFSGIFLVLDLLIYGGVYVWMHGQGIVVNKILKYNKDVIEKYAFSKTQKTIGKIILGMVTVELLTIVLGIIWALVDAISGGGGISSIEEIGLKIALFSFVAAALFATLIGVLFLYKRGLNLILVAIFIQLSPVKERTNSMAKIITLGLLSGIGLIIIGLLAWLIDVILRTTGGSETTLFTILGSLSTGLSILTYAFMALVFTILGLFFSFVFHNGYGWALEKVVKIEEGLSETLKSKEEKPEEERKEEG